MTTLIGEGILTSQMKTLFKFCQPDVPLATKQLRAVVFQAAWTEGTEYLTEKMIALTFLFALLWDRSFSWGFKDGVLHNSIWLGKLIFILFVLLLINV